MFMEKLLPILLSNSMWFSSFCSFFNTSFNYWVLGLPPSSITTLTVMLAALNFVLGASIRRLWALRTQRKSIERDVCAPVVLAHQHVVAPIWVQRDPERINHNHKSRGIGYKPLRSEDEPVHIEGSFCWCWSSREGGVGKPILAQEGEVGAVLPPPVHGTVRGIHGPHMVLQLVQFRSKPFHPRGGRWMLF